MSSLPMSTGSLMPLSPALSEQQFLRFPLLHECLFSGANSGGSSCWLGFNWGSRSDMSIMKQGLEFSLCFCRRSWRHRVWKGELEDQRIFLLSNSPKTMFIARSEHTGELVGRIGKTLHLEMGLQYPASSDHLSAGRAGSGVGERDHKLDPTAPAHHLLLPLTTDSQRVITPVSFLTLVSCQFLFWPVPTQNPIGKRVLGNKVLALPS